MDNKHLPDSRPVPGSPNPARIEDRQTGGPAEPRTGTPEHRNTCKPDHLNTCRPEHLQTESPEHLQVEALADQRSRGPEHLPAGTSDSLEHTDSQENRENKENQKRQEHPEHQESQEYQAHPGEHSLPSSGAPGGEKEAPRTGNGDSPADDGEMLTENDDVLSESDDELSESEDFSDGEDGGMFEHFRFAVDKGQALLRIDKYITEHMEKTSRHRIQLAIGAGYVRVNGTPVKANYKVKPLDLITIVLPYRRRMTQILPENIPLDIVYEDDHLLVIDKPAGLVVHPGYGHFTGTLVNALAYHLGLRQEPGKEDERMGILVHRIDKNTSGLLVVAKNDEAQLHLAKQFFDHTIRRNYVALVWGNLQEDEGTVTGHIGRDPNDRLRFKVFPDGSSGKHAVTHYRVLERFGYVTLIECRLETGRTHQIRVHMNWLGHPLFNDDRYGGDRILKGSLYKKYKQFIDNCFQILPRHALHARTLGFEHPVTGRTVALESPLPPDMTALIEKWRGYSRNREMDEE